jgi:hypothetical protein
MQSSSIMWIGITLDIPSHPHAARDSWHVLVVIARSVHFAYMKSNLHFGWNDNGSRSTLNLQLLKVQYKTIIKRERLHKPGRYLISKIRILFFWIKKFRRVRVMVDAFTHTHLPSISNISNVSKPSSFRLSQSVIKSSWINTVERIRFVFFMINSRIYHIFLSSRWFRKVELKNRFSIKKKCVGQWYRISVFLE